MLKILLTILISIEILIFALIVYCLSGVSFAFPGLGLIVAGSLIAAVLAVFELLLIGATIFLYRRMRRETNGLL